MFTIQFLSERTRHIGIFALQHIFICTSHHTSSHFTGTFPSFTLLQSIRYVSAETNSRPCKTNVGNVCFGIAASSGGAADKPYDASSFICLICVYVILVCPNKRLNRYYILIIAERWTTTIRETNWSTLPIGKFISLIEIFVSICISLICVFN